MEILAKDKDRLDQIVYEIYGSLDNFEQILELNPNLSLILRAGDRIKLPDNLKEQESKEEQLW